MSKLVHINFYQHVETLRHLLNPRRYTQYFNTLIAGYSTVETQFQVQHLHCRWFNGWFGQSKISLLIICFGMLIFCFGFLDLEKTNEVVTCISSFTVMYYTVGRGCIVLAR